MCVWIKKGPLADFDDGKSGLMTALRQRTVHMRWALILASSAHSVIYWLPYVGAPYTNGDQSKPKSEIPNLFPHGYELQMSIIAVALSAQGRRLRGSYASVDPTAR